MEAKHLQNFLNNTRRCLIFLDFLMTYIDLYIFAENETYLYTLGGQHDS